LSFHDKAFFLSSKYLQKTVPIFCRIFAQHYSDMKLLPTFLVFFLFQHTLAAQTAVASDTTIYEAAEMMPYPILKNCQAEFHTGWTVDSVKRCSETQLLNLLSANIQYPNEAREQNIQGTVVLNFVVEPNGRVSTIQLLKDIGGGCGAEAIRVLKAFDEAGLRWSPASSGGRPVRVKYTIPLRFRLQEALPYYITDAGDTVYTQVDNEPFFRAGVDSLIQFVFQQLVYPEAWEDSCKTGVFEMATIVKANGTITIENVLDFNDLGLDFQWEAMRLANKMNGMWSPANYEGKPVPFAVPIRVLFKSDKAGCETANANFDKAMLLSDEGAALLEAEKPEEAIKKWTDALALQPGNCEILYYRGTTLLNLKRREDACQDFNLVKDIMGVTWFESLRRLVCGQ
jgi:TonB family protein